MFLDSMDVFGDDDTNTVRTHINKANNYLDQQLYTRARQATIDGLLLDPSD